MSKQKSVLQSAGFESDDENSSTEQQQFYENVAKRALLLYDAANADFDDGEFSQAAISFTAFIIITADKQMVQKLSSTLQEKIEKAKTDAQEKADKASVRIQPDTTDSSTVQKSGENAAGFSVADLCSPILPTISFNELAGMEREKKDIQTAFIFPMLYPALFRSLRAALMYGPPGTGKTELAKASVASLNISSGAQRVFFFSADGASLKGKYVGETEKRIRGTFECAAETAGQNSLSVIFMDEIDAIGGKRSADDPNMATSVNALISSIEGAQSAQQFDNVKILSATNLPWRLDAALNRRFAQRIFVDLPNDLARMQIVSNKLQKYFIIDPWLRAHTYKLKGDKGGEKIKRLQAQINMHQEFLSKEEVSAEFSEKIEATEENLQRLQFLTKDKLYPQLTFVYGRDNRDKVPERVEFLQKDANENTRWDKFLSSQNKDGLAFDLTDLLFVGIWTGISEKGSENLQDLANHYGQKYYLDGGRYPPTNYIENYPADVETDFDRLKKREVNNNPQPAIYGYSASDVAKMTDQALNFAAMDFSRNYVALPKDVDICSLEKRGIVESSNICENRRNCCRLLPLIGEACEIQSLEQRRCIRSNRIELRHFVSALDRFASTVNPIEYCQTVEYFLSRETVEPGSSNAFCPQLHVKK